MSSLAGRISLLLDMKFTGSNDFGNPVQPLVASLLDELTSGTGDNQVDTAFSDRRTPGATTETLDLVGSLLDVYGGSFAPVEIATIVLINYSTTGAAKLGGAGSNPASTGLFGDSSDVLTVGAAASASKPSWSVWHSPKDGGGLQCSGGTADQLKVTSASGNLDYGIILLGRSA